MGKNVHQTRNCSDQTEQRCNTYDDFKNDETPFQPHHLVSRASAPPPRFPNAARANVAAPPERLAPARSDRNAQGVIVARDFRPAPDVLFPLRLLAALPVSVSGPGRAKSLSSPTRSSTPTAAT